MVEYFQYRKFRKKYSKLRHYFRIPRKRCGNKSYERENQEDNQGMCCSCRAKGWGCCALILVFIYLVVNGIAFLVDLSLAISVNEAAAAVYSSEPGTFTGCFNAHYLNSWNPMLLWGTCVSNLVHVVGATLLLVGVCHEKVALAWAWIPIAWGAHTLMLICFWLAFDSVVGFYVCQGYTTQGKSFYAGGYIFWHSFLTVGHIFTTVVVALYVKDFKNSPPLAYTEQGYAYRPES